MSQVQVADRCPYTGPLRYPKQNGSIFQPAAEALTEYGRQRLCHGLNPIPPSSVGSNRKGLGDEKPVAGILPKAGEPPSKSREQT